MLTFVYLCICQAFIECLLYTIDLSTGKTEVNKTSPVPHVTYILAAV